MSHAAFQRTVVLIKPDAVQRGHVGEIMHRFERKGLQLIGLKMMNLTDELLHQHYSHHVGKDFFKGLVDFMQSTPVVAMVWEGPNAINVVRTLVGPTKGHEAPAGTIRGDFSVDTSHNLVHASDSPETAAAEIERFFDGDEIFDYTKTAMQHVFESGRQD